MPMAYKLHQNLTLNFEVIENNSRISGTTLVFACFVLRFLLEFFLIYLMNNNAHIRPNNVFLPYSEEISGINPTRPTFHHLRIRRRMPAHFFIAKKIAENVHIVHVFPI